MVLYYYLKLIPLQVFPQAVILTENPSVSVISYMAVTSSNTADFANDNDTSATAAAESDGVGVLEAAAADFEH